MNDNSRSNSELAARRVRDRHLLRNGLIGAGLGIAYQVAGIIIYASLRNTVVYGFLDRVFWFTNAPFIRLARNAASMGLIQKHDALAFVVGLCIYSAILGFLLGIGISQLIRRVRSIHRAPARPIPSLSEEKDSTSVKKGSQ